jgi:YVTN family beta-propeller protein
MRSDKNNRSRALSARGALCVVLVMGLGLIAPRAEAAPFAYVANEGDNTVSVIDTTTNTVVGTPILVGTAPWGVAVTPDGKHAYVANLNSNNISAIDTATNTVVGIPVGANPLIPRRQKDFDVRDELFR